MKLQKAATFLSLVLVAQIAIQSSTPALSATSTPHPTVSSSGSTVNNYPPSRFQPGRPSAVVGLRVLSTSVSAKTITLTWNHNPSTENVDKYAVYYQGSVPAPYQIYIGIPVAVVSQNFLTSTLIAHEAFSNEYNPYGQNEIPICFPDACFGDDQYQVKIWVIAHNKFGWGDNVWFAPNPDENPANFSYLSDNQKSNLKAPKIVNINVEKINPGFLKVSWPAHTLIADYSNLQRPADLSKSETELVGNSWNVPWLSGNHLPISRFGPGRPSAVKGFQISVNLKAKNISFHWKTNPVKEKVDSYALYYSRRVCPDDSCEPFDLIAVSTGTSLNENLILKEMDVGQFNNGKTLIASAGNTSYVYFVIAHNANGWGDNDGHTPNPDQRLGDFRPLSWSDENLKYQPATGVTLQFPCSDLPTAEIKACEGNL